MNSSRKIWKAFLYLTGVLMVIGVYFLYYNDKQTQLNEVQEEVDRLQEEVAVLEKHKLNSQQYQEDTQAYYKQVDELVAEYPAEIKEETSIMVGSELEAVSGVTVSNIQIEPSVCVTGFGVGERQKELYSSAMTVDFTGNYDMIQKMIGNIQDGDDKRAITSLTLSYDDQTGDFVGNAKIALYAISGKGRVYVEPDTGQVEQGTGNIFGQ